jgi:hypothetical protein
MSAASLVWGVEVVEEGRRGEAAAGEDWAAAGEREKRIRLVPPLKTHRAKTRKGDGAIGSADGTKREGGNKSQEINKYIHKMGVSGKISLFNYSSSTSS